MSSQGVTVFAWLTCWEGRGCSHNVTWEVTLDQSCCLWPQGTGHAWAWWLLFNGALVTQVCRLLGSGERVMGGEKGGMRDWEWRKRKMETLGGTQAQRNGQQEDTTVTDLGHMLKWLKCGQSPRKRQSSPERCPWVPVVGERSPPFSFSRTSRTKCHKPGGSKQQTFILSSSDV